MSRGVVAKLQDRVLRVRYKDNLGTKTRLIMGSTKASKVGTRVLRVGKVSYEELHHVGGSNTMIRDLMKEFKTGKSSSSLQNKLNEASKSLMQVTT
jgi:hypothetical protein